MHSLGYSQLGERMDDYQDDSRIEAKWVVDSETSIWYLIDLKTNKVLMISTGDKNEH